MLAEKVRNGLHRGKKMHSGKPYIAICILLWNSSRRKSNPY